MLILLLSLTQCLFKCSWIKIFLSALWCKRQLLVRVVVRPCPHLIKRKKKIGSPRDSKMMMLNFNKFTIRLLASQKLWLNMRERSMIIDQSSVISQLNQLCAREDIFRCHLELERLGYACWYVSIGQWCKSRRKQSTLYSIKVWKIKLLSKLRAVELNCSVFYPIRLARWFNKTNWARNTPSFLMNTTRWSALQIWVILF